MSWIHRTKKKKRPAPASIGDRCTETLNSVISCGIDLRCEETRPHMVHRFDFIHNGRRRYASWTRDGGKYSLKGVRI